MLKTVLLLIITTTYTFSQIVPDTVDEKVQKKLVNEAYKLSIKLKNITPLEELLNSGKIIDEYSYTDGLISISQALYKIYSKDLEKYTENKDTSTKKILEKILENYEKAIKSCPRCELMTMMRRMEFLEYVDPESELYKSDLLELKKAGYQEDKKGLGLGFLFASGKELWIGGKMSAFALRSRIYKISRFNPDTKRNDVFDRNYLPIGIDALSINYAYNPKNQIHEAYFDFLHMNSPISLSLSQFGFQTSSSSPSLNWFYRPEVGIGFGILSISYAYNLMLKKEIRSMSESHLLTLRLNFIHSNKK